MVVCNSIGEMERRETMATEKKATTKSPAKKPETKAPKTVEKKTVAPVTKAPKTPKEKKPKEPKAPKVKVEKQWVRAKTPHENYKDAQAAQKESKDSGKPARIVRVVTFFIETKVPIKPAKTE
jgi:hypothetical protein